MGSPAKIIRKLTEKEILANITNAQHYVLNSQRFNQTLIELDSYQ